MIFVLGRDTVPESIRLGAGEKLDLSLVALPGVSADVSLTVLLEAPGAEADIKGLYLCRLEDRVRVRIDLRHISGGCTSHQLFKGVVSDDARFEFDGKILVAQDAQKTRAFQENHSILLNASAVVETRPQLEIYADDVECSHGATVGSLSEDELFYMRSRGIPEAQARGLQILSFLSPVLSSLPEDVAAEVTASL